jgi:hypothetical protein
MPDPIFDERLPKIIDDWFKVIDRRNLVIDRRRTGMEREMRSKQDWFTLLQFRIALQTGGFRTVKLIAEGTRFRVEAETRTGDSVRLRKTHVVEVRRFRDPTKALALLRGIGIEKVEVDLYSWNPSIPFPFRHKRPDVAERLRHGYERARPRLDGRGLPGGDLSA